MPMPASILSASVKPLRKTKHAVAMLASACLWLVVQPVFAEELADVTRLLRVGKSSEAMVKIDAFLERQPRDMQMRFVKGVVLTEQGKTAEAITVFTKLTEDHPDLPEPYNNLAVLFAASGQYEKARAALDMAIRTNPSYATAYENLGDVHAKLASQAYDKALQLDSSNANAKSKLTLLRTLTVNVAGKDGAKPTAAAAPVVTAAAAPKPAPVVVARVDAKPEVKVKPKPEPKPMVKPEPKIEAKAVAKAEPKPEPKVEPKPVAGKGESDEVLAVVNDWADAWSAQDMKRYLGHYGQNFDTPKGESRAAWAAERNARIVGKGRISVKVESPQVTVDGSTATVKFRQLYASDRLQADSRKTLTMVKQGGKWQIKQERTGS
jgi:tetratricopeptide (TPR) repeat protein